MAATRTFGMIKPDATARNITGKILARVEEEGFTIVGLKVAVLPPPKARQFYIEHAERPFYDSLVGFMSSGVTVLMVLEREDAVAHWRKTMGATDPAEADAGTIRAELGESKERNSTHGSDSDASAAREINFFFNCFELVDVTDLPGAEG